MRTLPWLVACGVVLAGCVGPQDRHKPAQAPASSQIASTNAAPKVIVTPDTSLLGKIVRVNENARFAVLNFPVGTMPKPDQILNVYRHGLKVGEVKVTGPQQNDNTVADILAGEVQVGDELRSN
jgi:hypothetical protein